MVVHACDPSYIGGIGRRITVQASLDKHRNPIPKITKAKRDQVVEHRHEALSSNPSTTKNK
jgi:hypothetical protein